MDDLISALQILRKYGNPTYPTHCEHDVLLVAIPPKLVSGEDMAKLKQLGFSPSLEVEEVEGSEWFASFKFGSC